MFRAVSSTSRRGVFLRNRLSSRSTLFNRASQAWLSSSADKSPMYEKLAFIGAGKMAEAMIHPLIKGGYQPEDKVAIFDVSTATMKKMQKEFPDIQAAQSMTDAIAGADMVVLAVKPQNVNDAFFAEFPKEELREDATLVSILAGTPIKEFEPSGLKKIVRAMPNTPATIGKGMTVWCCTPNLTVEERDQVKQVLSLFGKAVSSSGSDLPSMFATLIL